MSGAENSGIALRLKLPTGWALLPRGSYEIGRSVHCQVVLDGPKVSRLHARVVVGDAGATVEDLESANGVFLNNQRLARGAHPLTDKDTIVIGDFEVAVSFERVMEKVGWATTGSGRPTLLDADEDDGKPATATTKANALELLGTVAEQAINAGDAWRAEGILQARLEQVLDLARSQRCDPDARKLAFRLALLLAKALPSAKWFDYGVELLTAASVIPRDEQLILMEQAVAAVSGADARKLQNLGNVLSTLPPSMDKVRAQNRLEAILKTACGRRG